MEAPVKVLTLGGLKIVCGDEPAAKLGSRKAEALIVYLAATQKAQAREVLADMLWDERTQSQALSNLRWVLTLLRKHFEPHVLITRDSVSLNPEMEVWFDAAEFEARLKFVTRAGGVHSEDEADLVKQAIQLYQGEFLQGFYVRESQGFDQWMVQERERLHHLAISALSDMVEYYLRNRDYQAGIAQAARLLEMDPLMESGHRQLMQLLALSGKRALALKQYETLWETLDRELGIEPNEKSRELYEDIRAGRVMGEVSHRQASPVEETRPRQNLPPSLTPFVGREPELAKLAALIEDPTCRLVTLAGPGGIGKTRLAIQAAERSLHDFPQGAWFVRLEAIESTAFLPEAISSGLGLPASGRVPPDEQLLAYLQHKELLLVLDNFEQLLPGGTSLLIEILKKAPGVKLLVTSREMLNLQAEWLFGVRGLDYPRDEKDDVIERYPAASLFLQCARRVSGQAVPKANMACVAHITQLVEGSPLALELAAVWTRALTCEEIAVEIERGLGILQADQPDLPKRHRSMRAVFNHSWQLLSDEERAVFRQLSVFQGGFDRQAVEQVAGASLSTLAGLVDKSLLQQADGRYRVHELLRQFAAGELERADEVGATRDQHLAYFLALAQEAEPGLWRDQEKLWFNRLERELENLRQTVTWSLSPESSLGIEAGLRLVAAVEAFLLGTGHYNEMAGWLEDLLEHPHADEHPKAYANCLRMAGFLNYYVYYKPESRAQFERALAIAEKAGDPLILAHVLSDFSLLFVRGKDRNLAISERYLERSLGLYRDLGNQPGIATVMRRFGNLRGGKDADSYYEESLQIWKALGNITGMTIALSYLGRNSFKQGHLTEAREYLEEGLALFRELNNDYVETMVLFDLGGLEFARGEIAQARAYFEELLAMGRFSGKREMIPYALLGLGEISRYQEDYERAIAYYDEALTFFPESENKFFLNRTLLFKGFISLRQGDVGRARQLFEQGLSVSKEIHLPENGAIACIGLAGVSAAKGEPQRAAKLLGAAEGTFESIFLSPKYFFTIYPNYKRIKDQVREQLEKDEFNRLVAEGGAMVEEGLDRWGTGWE